MRQRETSLKNLALAAGVGSLTRINSSDMSRNISPRPVPSIASVGKMHRKENRNNDFAGVFKLDSSARIEHRSAVNLPKIDTSRLSRQK